MPAIGTGGSSPNRTACNFGQRPFVHTPPSGFKSLCTQNLGNPTIVDPSTAFDVITYTGDNSTSRTITTGLTPDIVWLKTRNNQGGDFSHRLFDTVRGTNLGLMPNGTNTEVNRYTATCGAVSAFTSDGFTLSQSGGNVPCHNATGNSMVAWVWNAGTAFSNASGSNGATMASSGRANQDAGISIVSYSYTGTSQYSYVHGLNKKPDLVIRKARNLNEGWSTYHSAMGFDERSYINDNAASSGTTTFRSDQGDPTSTLNYINNNNTSNVIEFVFAAVPGFSAFGRYEGNGSNDGPFIYTGFKPRCILLKNVDNYGSGYEWYIHDTARDPFNVSDSYIKVSTSDQEQTYNMLDILSNGFKIRNNLASYNQNSHTQCGQLLLNTPSNTHAEPDLINI